MLAAPPAPGAVLTLCACLCLTLAGLSHSLVSKLSAHCVTARSSLYYSLRGLVEFVPITRFCAEEHRARVDGRATARHLHGKIERAAPAVLP